MVDMAPAWRRQRPPEHKPVMQDPTRDDAVRHVIAQLNDAVRQLKEVVAPVLDKQPGQARREGRE